MTNQPSPVEEQEKLLEEALNVVKVQVKKLLLIVTYVSAFSAHRMIVICSCDYFRIYLFYFIY